MADLITGNTQLAATKQDLIAALVQRELKFQAKMVPLITDFSSFAVKGAKSVSIPKYSSFTVIDRASGAAGDASQLTATADKLDLDKAAYVAYIIDSQDEIQSVIENQVFFAQRAAAAHARYVDSQILTGLEAVAGNTPPTGAITAAKILEAREFLMTNDAVMGELAMVCATDVEHDMLAISDFIRADSYGNSPTALASGEIGRLYGVPVVVHNGLTAGQMVMFAKSGFGIAFQQGPRYSEQGANEYGSGAIRVAVDQLFGVKGLQLGEKGVGGTLSPLVWKLN